MTSKNETKQNSVSNTNQTTKPLVDPRVEGQYMNIADLVGKGLSGIDRTAWTGPAVAGGNTFDTKSILGTDQILQALQSGFAPGTFTNVALDAASGRLMDPATNPTLQGMINASTQPITEKLNQQIIPGIDNAAIMDGAFGGDRVALKQGQAYGDWAEASGRIASEINYDNYNKERQNQLNASQLFQQALNAETAIPQMYSQLGDYQRQLDQYGIDNELMQRVLQEQIGFAGLGQASSILNSLPFVGQQNQGTSTSSGTTTQTTKEDPLSMVVKGGLGVGATMAGLGWTPFAAPVTQAAGVRKIGFGMDANSLINSLKGLG